VHSPSSTPSPGSAGTCFACTTDPGGVAGRAVPRVMPVYRHCLQPEGGFSEEMDPTDAETVENYITRTRRSDATPPSSWSYKRGNPHGFLSGLHLSLDDPVKVTRAERAGQAGEVRSPVVP